MDLNVVLFLIIYMSQYAAADFTDGDAGTGDSSIENLSEFIKIDTAIENLMTATCNMLEKTTDDYMSSIKLYRQNLQKLCCAENLKLLDDFCKEDAEEHTIKTVLDLGKLLENVNFNPSSTDIFKNLVIDLSGSNVDLDDELGCDYVVFEKILSNLKDLYLNSLEQLFQADERLNKALEGVRYTFQKVNSILNLELNDSSIELYGSLAKYIHSTISKYNLKMAFDEFIRIRRKFIHYRVLLNSKNVINTEHSPLCSICLDKSVSHVLVGCGHTFCTDCTRKQLHNCYICRCKILQRMKIYLS